jgi:sigma-B regulation protein RsbQ
MEMNVLKRHNVTVMGAGEQTLMFAHGFGTDQSAWGQVADAFKDKYRIVLFDNMGKTDPELFSPYKYDSLQPYADDLVEITKTLGLKDVILIGHSVSGMVGLLSILKEPGLFSRLVMVGASPRYLNDTGYVGGFEQADLDGFYNAMETNYYAWVGGFAPAAMTYPDKPELADGFAATLTEIRPDIAQSVSRTIFQSDYRSELPKLKLPTLIIQSSNDIAVPQAVGEYLHKNIAGSKLVQVSATGHFPHISAPGQVIEAIREFI